ncbi:esterase-like activity of phytase family protein [Zobellia amurskyensis]|uniref:Esterase-like activity of phytase family protein n=1 Tax=Zobellia amurskyensis TaxID=248905 RepID=A0A7X2ZPY9_9FLAO|nr:esterase-like activity of phytase family protein [Zobellia amurskyensis]MUH34232.1 esterase-like activity of phytase family protein [Zobellia amurskyensis]
MKNFTLEILGLVMFTTIVSCEHIDDFIGQGGAANNSITNIEFVDEYVLPDESMYTGTSVGGLSGIDYADGKWYMISDDPNAPIRFYTADIQLNKNGFENVTINGVTELLNGSNLPFADGEIDPEAIRVTPGGSVLWSSEGNVKEGVDPFVRIASLDGTYKSSIALDEKFKVSEDENQGPRHNGVIEGLSVSYDKNGYWASMELPLVQDGPEPVVENTDSPVRIAYMNSSGAFGKEFAYELDPIARKFDETAFTVNGIVEILEYETNKFLVLERSFSTGFTDGGNNVKIYDVDASKATDVSDMYSLREADYIKATKELLFDFESVRSQLTDGVVDNIEGITFGPELENGNRSLVLVADNNFSAFGPQLNQFILLEVK